MSDLDIELTEQESDMLNSAARPKRKARFRAVVAAGRTD